MASESVNYPREYAFGPEGIGLGHYPELYVMVPRENLTKGRWSDTLEIFRSIPGSQVPDYEVDDPDAPVFEGEGGSFEVVVHGHKWGFHGAYVKDDSWPERPWPVPRGMGLICVFNYWDKGGPFDDTSEEYIRVAGAVMLGMEGDFANYANELNVYKVETYTEFLNCHHGTILLSRRVVEDLGLEKLKRFGEVIDRGDFIVMRFGEEHWAREPELWELLKSLDYLRPEAEMSPPPTLDEDVIGLRMERNHIEGEGQLIADKRDRLMKDDASRSAERQRYEERFGPLMELGELEAWAKVRADQVEVIEGMGPYSDLDKMARMYRRFRMLPEEMVLRRYMLQTRWRLYGGADHHSHEQALEFARGLMDLGHPEEAASILMVIWNSFDDEVRTYRTGYLERLVDALYESDQLNVAEDAIHEWIALENPRNNFQDVGTLMFLFKLVDIHLRRGEVEKASDVMERSRPYTRFCQIFWPNVTGKYMGLRARIELARHDLEKAEDLARRGVNYIWSAYYVGAEDVAYNEQILAEVLYQKGDRAGAVAARNVADDIIRLGSKEEYLKEKGISPHNVKVIKKG